MARHSIPTAHFQSSDSLDAALAVVDSDELGLPVVIKADGLAAGKGVVIAQFPASMGSQHDPLPIGNWKIKGVGRNPVFRYNPKLFWDAEPGEEKAVIPAGPNNPVGSYWIGLSSEGYGIHGTAAPAKISKAESHGCVRLTNWDASFLGRNVKKGTVVEFVD